MSEDDTRKNKPIVLSPSEIVRKMTGGGSGPVSSSTRHKPPLVEEPEDAWPEESSFTRMKSNGAPNGSNGHVLDYVGPLGLGLYEEGPICPFCVRSKYPGILWPVEHGEIRACPLCNLFVDHSKAAFFLSAVLGVPIAQDARGMWYTPLPEELMMSMARALRIGNADKKVEEEDSEPPESVGRRPD